MWSVELNSLAARQALVRSLALKIAVIFGHTDKSSLIHLSNLLRLYVYLCALRITTKRCALGLCELERETSKLRL